jgi:hypothetical protein
MGQAWKRSQGMPRGSIARRAPFEARCNGNSSSAIERNLCDRRTFGRTATTSDMQSGRDSPERGSPPWSPIPWACLAHSHHASGMRLARHTSEGATQTHKDNAPDDPSSEEADPGALPALRRRSAHYPLHLHPPNIPKLLPDHAISLACTIALARRQPQQHRPSTFSPGTKHRLLRHLARLTFPIQHHGNYPRPCLPRHHSRDSLRP